jgi:hypothetical protein
MSTTADSSLLASMVRRFGETQGNHEAEKAAQLLINAVKVFALPETRNEWFSGVAEGLQDLELPFDGLEFETDSKVASTSASSTKEL